MTTPLPRLLIGAAQGRSGKTTVTAGLCAALAARGLVVQPFKKGPDYIDPSWLSEAAGRPCRNLDSFFQSAPLAMERAFVRGAEGAALSIIEGNHGLYDSLDDDGLGSSAALARRLAAPVLLVVNAARMARSAAALVLGYQHFEPATPLAGVILNHVAQSRHESRLRRAIETHCGLPVLGALSADPALTIPERHLGLVPRGEDELLAPALAACRSAVNTYVNVDAVLMLARAAAELTVDLAAASSAGGAAAAPPHPPVARVGVFRDRAFSFYYPENLEALADAGAELVFVDSLHDAWLPPVDALYIGGGFPELFMAELEANHELRRDVRQAAEAGLPIYAECGGLMYLSRGITWGGRTAEMAGVLPCQVEMLDRPQGHGYVLGQALAGNPFLPEGAEVRGHEFHHSRMAGAVDLPRGYQLAQGKGLGGGSDGLIYRNVLASYTHLHAGGAPQWASGLLARARQG